MGILYILTLIVLGIAFMIFKKSEKKLNFIKWLIIYFVSLFGYNLVLGMVLGLLNITAHIWLLSLINIIFAIILSFKAIKTKNIQKYYVRKIDAILLLGIVVIFVVMFFKDLYIYKGDIAHMAIDSAIHYRAAKHYAQNLKIFINVEDKTFFNFNVMQTGAYINDGIFMNVINSITGIDYTYLYQVFETIVLYLSGLAFYAFFIDKVETKRGALATLVLFALYIYGYPYNSWFYGFSYLSVGIMLVTMLLVVVEYLYSEENVTKKLILPLIFLIASGLTFSYCLYVPAIFASICIYCFLKDFTIEGKTYFKFFKKTTLIVTALLLFITAVGIGYLVIPTFLIPGQMNLFDALKEGGGIYNERYRNFLPYTPFIVWFFVELVKRIKEKKLRYMDIFSVVLMGYFALLNIGNHYKIVSAYYMFKIYFITWLAILAVTVDLVNKYIDKKIFRIDVIIIFAIYVLLIIKSVFTIINVQRANPELSITELYNMFVQKQFIILDILIFLLLAIFTVLPQLIKKIDFSKLSEKISKKIKSNKIKEFLQKISTFEIKRICVSGYVFVILWGVFIGGWVWLKSGHLVDEEKKHQLPNLAGIYYTENSENRKLVDLTSCFNKNEIELATYARENIKDLNADNIELLTKDYYPRVWATAVLEINSNSIPYQNYIQDMTPYTVTDALNDPSKKYIVQLVSNDMKNLDEYKEDLKEIKKDERIEILFENQNGFVAKINR